MTDTEAGAGEFVYSYRPRVIGSGLAFRLGPHSLEWNLNGMRGQTAYPMITRVRLCFRPSNFGTRRFVAEIWSRSSMKLEIASASYKSMVSMEDQGPAYREFIHELHRRIVAAGSDCRFEAGFAAWRWWPMVAITVVAAVALLYVAVTTVANGELGAGVLIVAFMALFAWQMWPLVTRNRPQPYDPREIPVEVMP